LTKKRQKNSKAVGSSIKIKIFLNCGFNVKILTN
jgi:hypothetical protein